MWCRFVHLCAVYRLSAVCAVTRTEISAYSILLSFVCVGCLCFVAVSVPSVITHLPLLLLFASALAMCLCSLCSVFFGPVEKKEKKEKKYQIYTQDGKTIGGGHV